MVNYLKSGSGCSKHPLLNKPVKYLRTVKPNTLTFFVEKMREAFALQKPLTFFNKKYWCVLDISVLNFSETLTTLLVLNNRAQVIN